MSTKIIPKYTNITPKELYMELINSTYDQIRQTNNGLTYIPTQFGGIFGQNVVLREGLVMEVTKFEVT